MKKFAGCKTYSQIKAQCAQQGVPFDDTQYKKAGWDTVLVGNKAGGYVVYNTYNGRFSGKTPDGIDFTSDSPEHDRTKWMKALLAFFYVPLSDQGAHKTKRPTTAVDLTLGGVALLKKV